MKSLSGTVFVVLLLLKLTAAAAISWFWVFFPLWIGFAVMAAVGLCGLLLVGIIGCIGAMLD